MVIMYPIFCGFSGISIGVWSKIRIHVGHEIFTRVPFGHFSFSIPYQFITNRKTHTNTHTHKSSFNNKVIFLFRTPILTCFMDLTLNMKQL